VADETQLLNALTAGAASAGAELVKEATKSAYRGLKTVGKPRGARSTMRLADAARST
jgi:hypothetical protein